MLPEDSLPTPEPVDTTVVLSRKGFAVVYWLCWQRKDVDNQKDKRPSGTKYLGADMGYFLRFNRAIGMHRGFLPGYPASHGCVRQPEHMAKKYFENSKLGTPVIVVP